MKKTFLMTHTILQEALRGDYFSLALKLVVIQNSFELALDGGTKIKSANSHSGSKIIINENVGIWHIINS